MSPAKEKEGKRPRARLTVQQRYDICRAVEEDPELTHTYLASRFNCSRVTITRALRDKSRWVRLIEQGKCLDRMRERMARHPQLEQALVEWYRAAQLQQDELSDEIIRKKALEIAQSMTITESHDFKCGDLWLQGWKARHVVPSVSALAPAPSVITTMPCATMAGPVDLFDSGSPGTCSPVSGSFRNCIPSSIQPQDDIYQSTSCVLDNSIIPIAEGLGALRKSVAFLEQFEGLYSPDAQYIRIVLEMWEMKFGEHMSDASV